MNPTFAAAAASRTGPPTVDRTWNVTKIEITLFDNNMNVVKQRETQKLSKRENLTALTFDGI